MNRKFPAKGKVTASVGKVVRKAGEKPGIRNRKLEKHFNLRPILTSTSETSTTETSGVSSAKTTSRSESETSDSEASGSETSGSETSGSDSTKVSSHYNENVSKMKKPMAILCFISNNFLKEIGNGDDKKEVEEEVDEEDYSSDSSNPCQASSPATSDSDVSGDSREISPSSPSSRTPSPHRKSRVRTGSSSSRKQHQTGNDIRYPPKVLSKGQGRSNVYKIRADSRVESVDVQAGGDSSQKRANNKNISNKEDVKMPEISGSFKAGKQQYTRGVAEARVGGSRSSCGRKKVSFSLDDGEDDEIEEKITPANEETMLHFTSKFDGEGCDRRSGRVTKRFIFTQVR